MVYDDTFAPTFSLPTASSWASSHLAAESHSTRYHWYSSLVQLICRTQWILNAKLFRDAGCMGRERERKNESPFWLQLCSISLSASLLGLASRRSTYADIKQLLIIKMKSIWSAVFDGVQHGRREAKPHEKSLRHEQKKASLYALRLCLVHDHSMSFYVCIFSLKVSLVCLCCWSFSLDSVTTRRKLFWFVSLSIFLPTPTVAESVWQSYPLCTEFLLNLLLFISFTFASWRSPAERG